MEKGKRTLKAWWPCCALAACLTATTACRSAQGSTANVQEAQAAAVQPPAFKPFHTASSAHQVSSPMVYIYKTRKDYSRLVPVLMDETRTRIVSYPTPTDLKTNGKLAYPTPLENGYWLDNRGISPPCRLPLLYLRGIQPNERTARHGHSLVAHRGQNPVHLHPSLRPKGGLQRHRKGTERIHP